MSTELRANSDATRIAPKPSASAGHVLIVDDNPDIVKVIHRILSTQDYQISEATDGAEAIEKVQALRPDLLLLDIMLPKIDGLEVCRRLKANASTAGIMIILVTGRASVDHRVQGFDAGADDYIPKPFHVPELLARTRTAMRLKHLTDDLEAQNELLIKSQRDLVRAEKMATIGLLAAGIAHEFNNIMAGISAYAQLAKRDATQCDALIDVALTQTTRALELTRSLSTYNRTQGIDAGGCNVGEVIEDTLRLTAKEVEKNGVRVSDDVESDLYAKISAGNLQEIILNLVLNAIHAVESGVGAIVIKASRDATNDAVRIDVQDNGKGISPENLERIFDPFFTTKGALGGGNAQGTGLGLTVCYNMVNANHGRIDVTTGETGTIFSVTLPISKDPCPVAIESGTAIESSAIVVPEKELRILIVDDESATRDSVREFLNRHDVVCCSRVEPAVEAFAVEPFDYVILDVCLPGPANGFEAFERFQRFSPPPKIIFSSGRFPDETFQSYIRRAHGHLLKPFKLQDLAKLLNLSWEACHA